MTKGIKSIKRISAVSCVILFTVYLTVFGQSARESAARGLDICSGVILTTVFPFSVASSLLLSSGACDILGRTAFYPLGRLFGLSESGAGLLLPGLIGGFPAGAAGAAELYKSGRIGKAEAEKVISYTNNATPAFAFVFAGGISGSVKAGVLCWAVNIGAAFVWAVILRGKKDGNKKSGAAKTEISFASSVLSAFSSALSACAFVIIFSVISGALQSFLPPLLSCPISALLEISSGLPLLPAAGLDGRITASLVCFFTSFSGLCVASQVVNAARDAGLSVKYYFSGKIFQAFISFFAFYLLYPTVLS